MIKILPNKNDKNQTTEVLILRKLGFENYINVLENDSNFKI